MPSVKEAKLTEEGQLVEEAPSVEEAATPVAKDSPVAVAIEISVLLNEFVPLSPMEEASSVEDAPEDVLLVVYALPLEEGVVFDKIVLVDTALLEEIVLAEVMSVAMPPMEEDALVVSIVTKFENGPSPTIFDSCIATKYLFVLNNYKRRA